MNLRFILKIQAVVFVGCALLSAQTPGILNSPDALVQSAYENLRSADHDYGGHRINAMIRLRGFAKNHSIEIPETQDGSAGEQQGNSDQQLETALSQLQQVANISSLGKAPNLVAAIQEIQDALKLRGKYLSKKEVASQVSRLLESAYRNLAFANSRYGIKKIQAMTHVAKVAQDFGIELSPSQRQSHGQAASDAMLNSAKSEIEQAQEILKKNGFDIAASELNQASADTTVALSIR
jgi:hypothetical protein